MVLHPHFGVAPLLSIRSITSVVAALTLTLSVNVKLTNIDDGSHFIWYTHCLGFCPSTDRKIGDSTLEIH